MENDNKGKVRTGRAIASFLFPIVGIITVGQHYNSDKEKAKGYGFITVASILLMIVYAVIYRLNRPSKEELEAQKAQEELQRLEAEQRERESEQAFKDMQTQFVRPPKPTSLFTQ